MGVRLADDEIAIDGVNLTALIAGNYACRNAGGAHEKNVSRGVVFAEAAAGVEEEIVDGLLAEERRAQGVVEGFFAEEL